MKNVNGYNLWQDSDMRLSLPLLLCDIFTGDLAEQKAAVAVYLLERLIRNDDFEEMTRLLDEPKKSIVLEEYLRNVIAAANNGQWHNKEDCEIEGYVVECELCQAITAAEQTLATDPKDAGQN